APTLASLLGLPHVLGPVGGGESAPKSFWRDFSRRGRRYEFMREMLRWLAERDPLVRYSARSSRIALATTDDTAVRLRSLGAGLVEVLPAVALGAGDFKALVAANGAVGSP